MIGIDSLSGTSIVKYILPPPERPLVAPPIILNSAGQWVQQSLIVGRNVFYTNNYYKIQYVNPDFVNAYYYYHKQDLPYVGDLGLSFTERTRVYIIASNGPPHLILTSDEWILYEGPIILYGQDQFAATQDANGDYQFYPSDMITYYRDFKPGDYYDLGFTTGQGGWRNHIII
jgi:hypothetical protein